MVGAHPLANEGLLVLLDGKSHSIYWREEVGTLRLMVDAKTCLIEQENDPTQLRSLTPGKSVRFLATVGTTSTLVSNTHPSLRSLHVIVTNILNVQSACNRLELCNE